MATTNLIVDFLVVGTISIVWIAPILLFALGTEWLCSLAKLTAGHVPLILGALYAVGIPVSRLADRLTERWNDGIRDRVFGEGSRPGYHNQVNKIIAMSQGATDYLGYRRSIVRISRACALNFGLGALAWIGLWCLRRGLVPDVCFAGIVVVCVFGAWMMVHAWQVVLEGYFYSVNDIYRWLREEEYWTRRGAR